MSERSIVPYGVQSLYNKKDKCIKQLEYVKNSISFYHWQLDRLLQTVDIPFQKQHGQKSLPLLRKFLGMLFSRIQQLLEGPFSEKKTIAQAII